MKGLFNSFAMSAKEFTKLRSLTITAMLIGLSMIIEMFSIDIGFVKLNFAFIAIAVIGMLFGPAVGIVAGFACDIVGFIAHPAPTFLPLYTLAAGLQGLIYGILLYHKVYGGEISDSSKLKKNVSFVIRIVAARLLDVIIINLLINTALNMHYGFIPQAAYGAAIIARVAKNVIELGIDLPLLFVVLPAAMMAYRRVFHIGTGRAKA
ncbi:MAG: folate family ECF transporter S component [Ruminococcus sp.]